jgi:hypothetical protein
VGAAFILVSVPTLHAKPGWTLMQHHTCDQCGEPVERLFARRYRVPARSGTEQSSHLVWLCRDCRSLYNSPVKSCLLFIVTTFLIILSVPAAVGLVLGLIVLFSR